MISSNTGVILRRAVLTAFAFSISSVSLAAQTKPAPTKPMEMEHAHTDMKESATGWKELDAFHMLMMATWHPAKESNDMTPIDGRVLASGERTERPCARESKGR